MNLSRNILYKRHRLSHQQIDDLLGENKSRNRFEEKVENMEMIRTFHEITTKLRERNLWFLVLKGPLLSQRIYNDPVYRRMRDFDILTGPESVETFIALLMEMGFRPAFFPWPASSKKQRLAQIYMNQFGMVHPESGVLVEVHWRLFGHRLAPEKVVSRLIRLHLEETTFAGQPFFRFTIEFELLYLVIHGSMHAWFRLKWLVDVHEILIRFSIDEQRFNALVRQLNAERFVDVCNVVLAKIFPGGPLLPDQNSGMTRFGEIALQRCRKGSVPEKYTSPSSVAAFLKRCSGAFSSMRYKLALSPRLQYKQDVLRVLPFNKLDLQHRWIPPYAVFFWLFRPFGYVYRALAPLPFPFPLTKVNGKTGNGNRE